MGVDVLNYTTTPSALKPKKPAKISAVPPVSSSKRYKEDDLNKKPH
jgi:hypothetical protein